ncbi:MAG: hypothetical protein ACK5N0_00835 [Synechococcaceae cyanobacterium]
MSAAALLARLEQLSRNRPDRVLRLRGVLPVWREAGAAAEPTRAEPAAAGAMEPFELLIFRGFSSSITHPTGFDPDQPLLPEGSRIEAADLLAGPLNPAREQVLVGPEPVEHFLKEENWG